MKTIFFDNNEGISSIFEYVDPNQFSEYDFEVAVVRVLKSLYHDYHCIKFRGSFRYDERVYRSDLALISKNFSHWFIIEVELSRHSLNYHVLPQVKAFRFGEPENDCLNIISRELCLERASVETFIKYVPRSVVVIVNKYQREWEIALRSIDVQLVSLEIFQSDNGLLAFEKNGKLYTQKESLGFGVYQATDRSIRFANLSIKTEGLMQIDEPDIANALWYARCDGQFFWLTKKQGEFDVKDKSYIQLIRDFNGKLALLVPK